MLKQKWKIGQDLLTPYPVPKAQDKHFFSPKYPVYIKLIWDNSIHAFLRLFLPIVIELVSFPLSIQ